MGYPCIIVNTLFNVNQVECPPVKVSGFRILRSQCMCEVKRLRTLANIVIQAVMMRGRGREKSGVRVLPVVDIARV